MIKPLLSIVIATKNRTEYCIAAIKSIREINVDLVEINIADNSDDTVIKDFLESEKYQNLNYIYDPQPKSSIDNFNLAMGLATGEYVCMIGDDDTILPSILELTKWAKKNDVDSISCSNYIGYYWPGAYSKFPQGVLFIPKCKAEIKKIDVESKLKSLIYNGMVEFSQYSLPKTYHGIVKLERLYEIKRITGNFYGGLSPDIYSAVALACIVKSHYSVTKPFTIAGVCSKSTASASIRGEHSGKLSNAPHFKYRGNYLWDKKVPEYYSISTIWSESGLKALIDLNKIQYYNQFRSYRMHAQAIVLNRHILSLVFKETYKYMIKNNVKIIPFIFNVIFQILYLILDKLKLEFSKYIQKKQITVTNLSDIQSAVNNLSARMY